MIITYFLAGMCCGEFWPENPWRWGFWLTIPYGFALILLIMFNVLDGITDSAFAIVYGMIFIFIYFVSFLISSIGAYIGARIGARLRPHPFDKNQGNE